MKTIFLAILSSIFSIFQTVAQSTEILNFEKIYAFINAYHGSDTLTYNLSDQTSFQLLDEDSISIFDDEFFSEADRDYLKQQLAWCGKASWQNGKIKGAKVIRQKAVRRKFKHADGWNKFHKKYGACLTSYSLPLFNLAYTYCIFYHWTQCDYLAGGGSIDLYQLVNGKWIFVKSYVIGMS